MLAMMPAMTAWKPGERLLVYLAAVGVEVEMLRSAAFLVTTLGLQTMAGLTAVMWSVLPAVNYRLVSMLPLAEKGLQVRTDVGT